MKIRSDVGVMMALPPRQVTRSVQGRTSRGEALRAPMVHTFIRGVGYVHVGDPPKFGSGPGGQCNPPNGVSDLSHHELKPPGGAAPIVFKWMAKPKAWWRHDSRSRRLGYSPDYLSSHGWKYLGPTEAQS